MYTICLILLLFVNVAYSELRIPGTPHDYYGGGSRCPDCNCPELPKQVCPEPPKQVCPKPPKQVCPKPSKQVCPEPPKPTHPPQKLALHFKSKPQQPGVGVKQYEF
ncbi:hypothetical protein ACJMK2_013893, partial [Sinanodonta woodiana]